MKIYPTILSLFLSASLTHCVDKLSCKTEEEKEPAKPSESKILKVDEKYITTYNQELGVFVVNRETKQSLHIPPPQFQSMLPEKTEESRKPAD
jgi:hypothetical protein